MSLKAFLRGDQEYNIAKFNEGQYLVLKSDAIFLPKQIKGIITLVNKYKGYIFSFFVIGGFFYYSISTENGLANVLSTILQFGKDLAVNMVSSLNWTNNSTGPSQDGTGFCPNNGTNGTAFVNSTLQNNGTAFYNSTLQNIGKALSNSKSADYFPPAPEDTSGGISESNKDYASLISKISTKEVDDTFLRENILPLLADNSTLNRKPYITNQPTGHYYQRRGPNEIQNIREYIKAGSLTVEDFDPDKLQRESGFLTLLYALI